MNIQGCDQYTLSNTNKNTFFLKNKIQIQILIIFL